MQQEDTPAAPGKPGHFVQVSGGGQGRPAVRHTSCHTLRRVLTRHSTVNFTTGALTDTGRATWSTKACDVPLFSPQETASGVCHTCASGWTHPENYPLVPVFEAAAHARFSLDHWRQMAARAGTREEHRRAAEGIAVWTARCAALARVRSIEIAPGPAAAAV